MRNARAPLLLACLLLAACSDAARAQIIEVADHERLPAERPEAWAMHWLTASTLMTAFGAAPTLAPGDWQAAVEFGHLPHLSERQRRVGFDGTKLEDLNKSPVFGRARIGLGLPGGWQIEFGYTPPLEIDGARPRRMITAALRRTLWTSPQHRLIARAFGQHGEARGDITCPRELAGSDDPALNPFGCRAPSDDRIALNHYGIEATLGAATGDWRWHASLGLVRSEPAVNVDARVFSVRDRTRLVARDVVHYLAAGVSRSVGTNRQVALELLYVPLEVRRSGNRHPDTDALASLRFRLAWRGD